MLWAAIFSFLVSAGEVALTFDDTPNGDGVWYTASQRTDEFIRILKMLQVSEVMIFANPCKPQSRELLGRYMAAGHVIGNHTCTHPRLDEVGFDKYSQDAADADALLAPFFVGQKYFRFPYLNEGSDIRVRDQMRQWLKDNNYRNGYVSIDTDEWRFAEKLDLASKYGKKRNPSRRLEKSYVEHVLHAMEFYDALAQSQLGRSPKHVLLLHDTEPAARYLSALVKAIRKKGWKIIPVSEAYTDPLYAEPAPLSTYSGQGWIAQLVHEKTGRRRGYDEMDERLNREFGLPSSGWR